jgi:hypothetical protein
VPSGDIAEEEPSLEVWLERRGLSFEEVANAVYPAVEEAARRYDPGHESGASFPTFAMKNIKGGIAHIAMDSPPLAGLEGPEDHPQEEPHPEEELLDFADIVALVRKHRKSDTLEKVYQRVKYPDEYSSRELRRIADLLEENFAEELKQDAQLRVRHSSLVVMSIRAEDYEGRMVSIGILWHILLIREDRRARGERAESYSSGAARQRWQQERIGLTFLPQCGDPHFLTESGRMQLQLLDQPIQGQWCVCQILLPLLYRL